MKKTIILFSVLLMLCGCSIKEATINNKTINPIKEKFEYEAGKCLCNFVAVEYSTFNRGDEIEIIKEDDDFYYINKDSLVLAIDKGLVRTDKDEKFEEYDGFARSGSGLYSDYELNNKIKELSLNDNVKVIDSFMGVLYVSVDGINGYMKKSQVSEDKISTYVAPKPVVEPVPDGSSSHSSHDDKPSPAPTPTSEDGEDISIAYNNNEYETILLEDTNVLKGMILADDTVAYLTVLKRFDDVKVVDKDDEKYTILIQGRKTTVDRCFVRLDSENMYEAWDAYTYDDVPVYLEYQLKNIVKELSLNTYVRVIDQINDVYVIEYDNESIGYIDMEDVSGSSIEYDDDDDEVLPAPVNVDTDSGSGGSKHNDPPAPKQDPDWTVPTL